LWVAPEVETTYYPDNAPVKAAEHGNAVRFTAPREEQPLGTNLQKELEIELGLTGSEVRITHRIRNDGTQPTKLAAWAPTMMRAGGRAILPFSPRIAMDKDHYLPVGVLSIWSYTDFADTRWSLKHLTKPPPRQLACAHCSFAYSALASFRMGMSGSRRDGSMNHGSCKSRA
jgi:hypothetical protein